MMKWYYGCLTVIVMSVSTCSAVVEYSEDRARVEMHRIDVEAAAKECEAIVEEVQ